MERWCPATGRVAVDPGEAETVPARLMQHVSPSDLPPQSESVSPTTTFRFHAAAIKTSIANDEFLAWLRRNGLWGAIHGTIPNG